MGKRKRALDSGQQTLFSLFPSAKRVCAAEENPVESVAASSESCSHDGQLESAVADVVDVASVPDLAEDDVTAVPNVAVTAASCSGPISSDPPASSLSHLVDIGEAFRGMNDEGRAIWSPVPRSLSEGDKRELIGNKFEPDKFYKFTSRVQTDGKKRTFQRSWLDEFPFLVFSPACNGGLCLPCLLFAPQPDGGNSLGRLYSTPLTNFTCFKKTCKTHRDQTEHRFSVEKYNGFLERVVVQSRPDALQQMTATHSKQSQENLEKLANIIKTIVFCGRQNLPLRGHRGEAFQPGRGQEMDRNPGNFLALLEFRADAGDTSVARDFHMQKKGKQAQYSSHRIQNDVIACCGDVLRQRLVSQANQAPFFAVLADEAADVSNKEQMPIVIRYVDTATNEVCEQFLGFAECDQGTTGEALASLITHKLSTWGLDLSRIRGQGYDGAGNMAGAMNGCAARIQRQYPKAVYLHCSAHALNLCIMATSKTTTVSAMWTTLLHVGLFFNSSPKRQGKLAEIIQSSDEFESGKAKKLVDLCRTRWVARHSALVTFKKLYPSVVAALEEMSTDRKSWNADTVAKAGSFLRSITDSQFLTVFTIVSEVMARVQSLTISLQKSSLDIVQGYSNVQGVQDSLKKLRADVDSEDGKWFGDAVSMTDKAS